MANTHQDVIVITAEEKLECKNIFLTLIDLISNAN